VLNVAERDKAKRLRQLQKEISQYQTKVNQTRLAVQVNFQAYTEAYNTLSLLEAQLAEEWQSPEATV
jgi:uncharacterized protein YlxW (UPF0749 family)